MGCDGWIIMDVPGLMRFLCPFLAFVSKVGTIGDLWCE